VKARNAVLTERYPVSVVILHTRSLPSLTGSDDGTNAAFTVMSDEGESKFEKAFWSRWWREYSFVKVKVPHFIWGCYFSKVCECNPRHLLIVLTVDKCTLWLLYTIEYYLMIIITFLLNKTKNNPVVAGWGGAHLNCLLHGLIQWFFLDGLFCRNSENMKKHTL